MKKLVKLIPFATTVVVCQMQACFTPAFQSVWDFYAKGEFLQEDQEENNLYRQFLQEEYGLYQRFLIDRCQQLSMHWQRCCSLRQIQIDIVSDSMPRYQGLSVSFFGGTVTFNIGWFRGKPPEYDGIDKFLMAAARPLIKENWQIEIADGSLLRSSRLQPCVTFLHELTHLILRMDFILAHGLTLDHVLHGIQEEPEGTKKSFEEAYQIWVVDLLSSTIHRNFSLCLSLDPFDDVNNAYQACWGGRDEILVIIGVRLMLEGEEHVLGETMLLRRLAQLLGLPSNFVCWSHTILSFSDSDGNPMIVLDRPSLEMSLFLFELHKIAFMALCHHLGWDDVLPPLLLIPLGPRAAAAATPLLSSEEEEPAAESQASESQEDAVAAAGPIPISSDD
jgi:hypothetical protein